MNLIHIVCVMFLCLHSLDNHRKRFGGSWFDMRLRYSCCLKSMYISNIYIYMCVFLAGWRPAIPLLMKETLHQLRFI